MRKAVVIAITAGVFVFSSCGEPKLDRVKRLVAVKVETERQKLENKCRLELIEKAIAEVDSIIIQKALQDTSAMMIRPVRPDVPSLEIPDIDTLGIKPLFSKDPE